MLVERRLIFSCTGFKAISIGMVTNFSISSALRPGHCVMMVTSVLVTSGNASIGIVLKVTTPVTSKITVANKMKYLFLSEKDNIDFKTLFITIIFVLRLACFKTGYGRKKMNS